MPALPRPDITAVDLASSARLAHPFSGLPSLFRSIAVATTPIEQIVDSHLQHLNVAIALSESVAREERGACRNGKCPIVQR
jgi:hypothetical protein